MMVIWFSLSLLRRWVMFRALSVVAIKGLCVVESGV